MHQDFMLHKNPIGMSWYQADSKLLDIPELSIYDVTPSTDCSAAAAVVLIKVDAVAAG